MPKKKKSGTSYNLSDTALELIDAVSGEMGISKASVIEISVRDLAKARGLIMTSPLAPMDVVTQRTCRVNRSKGPRPGEPGHTLADALELAGVGQVPEEPKSAP